MLIEEITPQNTLANKKYTNSYTEENSYLRHYVGGLIVV